MTCVAFGCHNRSSKKIEGITFHFKIAYHKSWKCQHSCYRKQKDSARNADCKAYVDVKIKRITKWTTMSDSFLKMTPPLPCVIKLHIEHSHSTETAASQRMLRVEEEVKFQYIQYFLLGMGPTEAKHFHQREILCKPDGYKMLADASQNPTQRQINHIYETWRNENLGSVFNPLQKLAEKVFLYEEKGCTVKIIEDTPWAVLVVTPVMKRIQKLDRCGEIIFMDSTASVEVSESTMTVLLTATQAGAVPIAALIHECQTMESYIKALQLLKQNFPSCFGGKEAPLIFMTDDSAAEKGALRDLWPTAHQLLCQFHVAQAEWRWLHGKYSEVPLQERKRLMKLFQAVMYADSLEGLKDAENAIRQEISAHSKFVERFSHFFLRRKEWISFDREFLLTRGNNTNNFSESMMRILKDVVLSRMKAYNVTALVEYCVTTWEDDIITKLLDFAYSRRKTPSLAVKAFSNSMEKYSEKDVSKVDDTTYVVPSATLTNMFYSIDTSLGVCTCPIGTVGAFCKHQAFLLSHLNVTLPNAPINSAVERHNLALIALGEKCPEISFFHPFEDINSIECTEMTEVGQPCTSVNVITEASSSQHVAFATQQERAHLLTQMQLLVPQNVPKYLATSLSNQIEKILKSDQQLKTLQSFAWLLKSQRKRIKKIHVQPTSISRRRLGITRGRSRITSGRPNKRQRNLTKNVNENLPNAKSHNRNE